MNVTENQHEAQAVGRPPLPDFVGDRASLVSGELSDVLTFLIAIERELELVEDAPDADGLTSPSSRMTVFLSLAGKKLRTAIHGLDRLT